MNSGGQGENFPLNDDLENIITPVRVERLAQALNEASYCAEETQYLVRGFSKGFDLEYKGPLDRMDHSQNIPLRVGSVEELWEKMLKEVQLRRFAGPYKEKPPFKYFIQSPVGLVPKSGGQTRLIFHLSYQFKNGNKSVNEYIPDHLCSVKYNDLDHAVRECVKLIRQCNTATIWLGIADLKSAFRLVPLSANCWNLLCMKAHHPKTGVWYYFVDKCLPFGASISCAIFQRFSNALAAILKHRMGYILYKALSNYLDDFLNIALSKQDCNQLLMSFHELCDWICVPLAKEKTIWATVRLVFLGILLDGETRVLAVPVGKVEKAVAMLEDLLVRKKATVKHLQKTAGLLNFLHRAIYPGRAFTRRMYAKFSIKVGHSQGSNSILKPYHHVNLDNEFKQDCMTWLVFLKDTSQVYCRPFTDFDKLVTATEVGFSTDSSASAKLGFGGICLSAKQWFWGRWEDGYIENFKPSIEYLELYAVCVGLFIWAERFTGLGLLIHCDNMSVVSMVNNMTSGCKRCMHLMRLLVLCGLKHNFRVRAVHITSKNNDLADSLSRLQFSRFFRLAGNRVNSTPEQLPSELWPISEIWDGYKYK